MKKWKWIGHTLRKDQNNIIRQELDWNPQGKRRKGRSGVTWKVTVLAELQDKIAKQMAKNRVRWRKFDGPMYHLATAGNDNDNEAEDRIAARCRRMRKSREVFELVCRRQCVF
jgi:hypothetical protein